MTATRLQDGELFERLRETVENAYADLVGGRTDHLRAPVRRAHVGERVAVLELHCPGGRVAGVAHRPPGSMPPEDAIEGSDGFDLLDRSWESVDCDSRVARSLGMAAVNALSEPLYVPGRGDPVEALSDDVAAVATVGAFHSTFAKFDVDDLRVVQREPVDPTMLDVGADVSVSTFLPDEREMAFEGADVAFVSGSALVYGGIERYLETARSQAVPSVVVAGPTASFLPTPAFEAGATAVAGVRVTDSDRLAARLRDDPNAGYHGPGVRKVCAVADGDTPALDLETEG